jgi:NADH:ubiquinone oxidoreductase subunit 6 (subunit J)
MIMLPTLLAAGPPGDGAWGALWRILLPAAAGAAAVYLLLPRPRPLPASRGLAAGLLALVLAAVLLVPAGAASAEAVLFYAFSAIAVFAGGLLVTQRNPARAALSFALVVLASCGLFLLLAAPFLMAATIIIYAGAIVVTFLFVLMLAQQEGPSDADFRSREPLLATLTGFLLLGALLYVIRTSYGTHDLDRLLERTRQAAARDNKDDVARAVGEAGQPDDLFAAYIDVLQARGLDDLANQVKIDQAEWVSEPDLPAMRRRLEHLEGVGEQARNRLAALRPPPDTPLSDLSGPPATVAPGDLRRDAQGRPALPAQNAAYLGRSLFSDFLLPVELGGTLLLVAAVGAIAIAQRHTQRERLAATRPGAAPGRAP